MKLSFYRKEKFSFSFLRSFIFATVSFKNMGVQPIFHKLDFCSVAKYKMVICHILGPDMPKYDLSICKQFWLRDSWNNFDSVSNSSFKWRNKVGYSSFFFFLTFLMI